MTDRVLVTNGKHCTEVYDADDLEAAATLIINDRIDDGIYTDEEIVKAREAIEAKQAVRFLYTRKRCEYEGYELLPVKRAE